MTTPTAASPWERRSLGREEVWMRTVGDAVMVFGIGPPSRGQAREKRLAAIIDSLPGRLQRVVHCRQVHGSIVHRADTVFERVARIGEGDGMVGTVPAIGLLVWTADCVPALLSGPGVIAAVHSGWRGCAADVLSSAVDEIERVTGARPDELHLVLGPSICGDCYQVGGEVIDALTAIAVGEESWRRSDDHVDLRVFLRARARALGIPADAIELVGGCTRESPELASYRRDGAAADRQWAMVFLDR